MLPAVLPGDVLNVRRCDLAGLNSGQILLFRRDGILTAHRIHHLDGNRIVTRGDSLAFFDPPVEAAAVVGRVTSISRGGRTVDPEQTLWQRIAAFLLRHSDFCLRATIYLHRHRQRPAAAPPVNDALSH